jgi:hypothetical protein
MIISGLLLTLSEDAGLAAIALATLRARPEVMLAECAQRWLPVVVEVPDVAASRDLHDWLNALPGVDFVDVVQVNFEEEALLTPRGLQVCPPSGALEHHRPSRRRKAAAVPDADAPHERAASISTVSIQEVTHEH